MDLGRMGLTGGNPPPASEEIWSASQIPREILGFSREMDSPGNPPRNSPRNGSRGTPREIPREIRMASREIDRGISEISRQPQPHISREIPRGISRLAFPGGFPGGPIYREIHFPGNVQNSTGDPFPGKSISSEISGISREIHFPGNSGHFPGNFPGNDSRGTPREISRGIWLAGREIPREIWTRPSGFGRLGPFWIWGVLALTHVPALVLFFLLIHT